MIGAGIFTTSGIMAAHLPGPGWVMLCWLFGGAIALAGALCYAELATRMPEEGGEYVYLKKLYHPVLGFLTGWTSFFVGFSVPIAASAVAFTEYIFAGLQTHGWALEAIQIGLIKKASALALIVLFTAIHYLGIRIGSRVQNTLTGIKIVLVLGLAGLGIASSGRTPAPVFDFHAGGPFSGLALGTAMMLVMFSYSGWNASSYIAGELKNPRKTLPVSLVLGTLIVVGLYLGLNLFIFRTLPYAETQGVIAIVEKAASQALGSGIGDSVGLIISIALLSSLSAFILLGPRVYYAMAKDRLFFPFASKLHRRTRIPGRAIIIQGIVAAAMVLIGSFEQLLIYMGFALNIFPWLAIAGLFLARKRKIGEAGAFRVWGHSSVPVFFLCASLGLMVINALNRPLESAAAVLTILAGIPFYFFWIKKLSR